MRGNLTRVWFFSMSLAGSPSFLKNTDTISSSDITCGERGREKREGGREERERGRERREREGERGERGERGECGYKPKT